MTISKKKFSLEKLKKTDQLVVRTGRDKNVDRVIFPNPVEVGLDADTLRSSLTTHGGLKIPVGAPSETNDVLYNDGGVLKFGGNAVITGSNGIVHLERLGITGSIDISGPLRVTGGIVTDDSNSEFIRAGSNVTVTKNADNSFTINASVPGGGAGFANPKFLTLAATGDLNNERVFTAGTGISATDGGAGGAFTVSTDTSVVAHLNQANTFTENVTVSGTKRIKGSIQKLADGSTDYIQAGSNVSVVNNADGSITVSATDTNTDTTYSAGNGLELNSSSSPQVFSVNLASGAGLRIISSELAVNPSDLAGTGLKTNGANTALEVEPAGFAGHGLEDDGSDNLRIAASAAGDGLTGGGGNPLSLNLKSGGGLKTTSDQLEVEPSNFAGDGLSDDGSDNLKLDISNLSTELLDNEAALADHIAVSDVTDNVTKKLTINRLKSLVQTSVSYNAGDGLALSGQTFKQRAVITVSASGGKFFLDGQQTPLVSAPKTLDYYFDLSDNSMSGKTFALSTTRDGTHNGGTEFTNGVTSGGTPGSSGAFLEVKFTQEDPDVLYYYDGGAPAHGNKLITGLGYLETDTSAVTIKGPVTFDHSISGSIQKLKDGTTDYIQAGSNITVTNNPAGSITISSDVASAFTAGDGIDIAAGTISTDLKAGGGLKITGTELEVDDTVVPKLVGATFTGNVTVPGAGGIRGSIQKLADNSTDFIQAGANVTVTNNANGSITIASAGGGGGGGSGTIGSAEDGGGYTDGLFTDFTSGTSVGTAVDRFNEVLKALAPDPAPNLTSISVTNSGVAAKLSFGTSNALSGYTNVGNSAGLGSAVDTNGTYQSATSGNNVRIGVVPAGTTILGIVASNVSANSFEGGIVNYPAQSIGSGDQGTLQLWINGSLNKTINLADVSVGAGAPGSGTGTDVTDGSGFTNISATAFGKFSNGSSFEVFKHRTARFQVGPTHMRNGWNYVQVKHVISSTEHTTNFVEWLVDETTDGGGSPEPLAAGSNSLSGLAMTGTKYLSGVKYNTGGTANYAVTITNAYKDVYSLSNITFAGTSCAVPSQAFPAMGGGEDSSKSLSLTGVASINDTKMLNESMSVAVNVPHPLRSNLTSAGSSSISGLLVYNITENSTVLSENFSGETYRLQSSTYNNQSDVGSGTWNSSSGIAAGGPVGHVGGLMVYNNSLVSPTNGINGGDFRNSSDGGIILNGPSGNVNYSGTGGSKHYYRRFTNNTGGSKTDFNLSMNTSGTNIVSSDTSLSSTNVHVFVKLPQNTDGFSTAWLDIRKAFATGQVDSDGDGCLVGTFDSSANSTNRCTFGTQSAGNNEYIILRVQADASWTGNISQISVSWI